MQIPRDQVTQAPTDPVAYHGLADGPAHDEPHSRGLIDACPDSEVPDQQRPPEPAAASDRGREVGLLAHPGHRGQHRTAPLHRRCRAAQTLTRARPLRRRDARMARPARVRMRSLNPCVFARRRLFGWNVRLLTDAPDTSLKS